MGWVKVDELDWMRLEHFLVDLMSSAALFVSFVMKLTLGK